MPSSSLTLLQPAQSTVTPAYYHVLANHCVEYVVPHGIYRMAVRVLQRDERRHIDFVVAYYDAMAFLLLGTLLLPIS